MQHATQPDPGKLRKAANEGVQAAVWVAVFLVVALLVVLGIAWGLGHRWSVSAPELRPGLPTLPGRTPEPRP